MSSSRLTMSAFSKTMLSLSSFQSVGGISSYGVVGEEVKMRSGHSVYRRITSRRREEQRLVSSSTTTRSALTAQRTSDRLTLHKVHALFLYRALSRSAHT